MNKISNRQMFYLILMTIVTYSLINIPYFMARAAGRGAWLPIAVAGVIFSFTSLFVSSLNNMYKDKMLVEYGPEIVGRFLSNAIAVYYLLYFSFVSIFFNSQMIGMINAEFLPDTPKYATTFAGLLVFGYIAYKGFTNIGRLLEMIVPAFLIFSFVLFPVALLQGHDYNIRPLYEPDKLMDYIKAIPKAIIPFLGIEIMLFIPFHKNNKPSRLMFLSMIFIAVYYILVVESTINVVGINSIIHYQTAVIDALRLVEFPIIERVDILYLTIGFCSLFAGASIVYGAVVEIICKLFKKARREIATGAVGVFLYIATLLNDFFTKSIHETLDMVILISGLIASVFLPAILLITAKVRKNVKKSS